MPEQQSASPRRSASRTSPVPVAPALTSGPLRSLAGSLASSRRAGGPDGDVFTLCSVWSAALREQLDTTVAATGSVGRGDATPASDLDVIRLDDGPTPGLDRLLAAGVRSDRSGATPASAGLPGRREDWEAGVLRWCAAPDRDRGVVKTGLLADAADPVSAAAAAAVPGSAMVADMLRDALAHSPPRTTGLFRAASLDLKGELLTPVVKIARWAALGSGSCRHRTVDRLEDAADAGLLAGRDAGVLVRAYRTGLSLSLDLALGTGPSRVYGRHGRIMFSALHPGDERDLRRAVSDLRGVCRTLRYRLSTSTFTEV
ncbi:putative nucleotidyltransferase substrate binding domain-containing protein [Corynebacterium provencense]|uniref:putative nucleotidyltransferase substrate binding domain-containing protein n=1 Tax=Corynebacterium provencense TaxID=1737425 RepID=UPI001D1323E2|nr:putative nucleotidyltransferase substrate binding domain-containing protein [Corynebacterium provencense]